jgi:alpha-tubulin suppressor-like RCC1 family protein
MLFAAKSRREPKASKPKLVEKMSSKYVVSCACNYGSCAFVTKNGGVYIFGKDAGSHCVKDTGGWIQTVTHRLNPPEAWTPACMGGSGTLPHESSFSFWITGQVTDLRHVQIVAVAMGKAHIAAVSSEGVLYTFGMNNRGQCGRHQSSTPVSGRHTCILYSAVNQLVLVTVKSVRWFSRLADLSFWDLYKNAHCQIQETSVSNVFLLAVNWVSVFQSARNLSGFTVYRSTNNI